MLTLVKIGGRVVADPAERARVAGLLGHLGGRVVVVHGGGVEVSDLSRRLGIGVRFHEGLRVTTRDGLKAASMALSGWTNKRLVGALSAAGRPAVGISGEDGRLVSASPKGSGELGAVGTVERVEPSVLVALLEGGFTPVVSPMSAGPCGWPLNVNADEVAGALASALRAERLLLVSDAHGVVSGGRVVPALSAARAVDLLADGTVTEGMRVKLTVALEAARSGISARIGDVGILEGRGGTRIARTVAREVA